MADKTATDGNCVGNMKNDESDITPSSNGDNKSTTPGPGMAWMTVAKDDMYYKMDHKKQGYALIFNHHRFKNSYECPKRHGTDVDVKKLANCLRSLGFDVQMLKDLKLAEIQFHIHQVANMDHTHHNCFVVVVLSHGHHDLLHAYDEDYNPNQVLWHQFTADKCPSLAGKPKLFFLQACQGDDTDPGIKLVPRRRTETDGDLVSYTIPVYADLLILYATARDHFAFRNNVNGSYFITVLCEELDRLAYTEHLLTILTIINQRVATEFVSYNTKNEKYHNKKQMPYFKSSLTRLLKFGGTSKIKDGRERNLPDPSFNSTGNYRPQQ